jgi:hypothetical protein
MAGAPYVRHEVALFECGRGKAATRPVSNGLSPIPTCVAGNGGVRSSGYCPRRGRTIRPIQAREDRTGDGQDLSRRRRHAQQPERWLTKTGKWAKARSPRKLRVWTPGPGAERAPTPVVSRWCGTWKPCWGLVARSGGYPAGQLANRKGGTRPQQDKMLQEANAVSRKVPGIHNRTDRAHAHPARGLTWSRGPAAQR